METPGGRGTRPRRTHIGFRRGAYQSAALLLIASAPIAAQEPGKPPLTPRTAVSGGPVDPDQAKLTFDSADLAFEILPDRRAISGVATLTFVTMSPVTTLVVDLDRNLPVTAIEVDGARLARAAWTNPEGRMRITLPAAVPPGRRLVAKITYGGVPHVAVRAPWDGGFVWSQTPAGAPWIATAVQGEGCDLFWPCIDHPSFEPRRIDLHVTVPRGLKAISNGRLVGTAILPDGRSTWNWSVANPTPYAIALNIAPYEVIEGTYQSRFGNSFPMYYWYLPGKEAKARGLFAEFAPTLDFFEATVGPYPFAGDKMGVVETPHLGMEHQTVNAYGNGYKKAPEGFDWLFQHELAHEWFANQLTNADWDDMWLHEGYGAYMQPLYGRWREGEARYATMMDKSRNTIVNKAPIVSGKPMTSEQVYETGPAGDIYVKGAWVLHTLRNLIGDKAFKDVTTRIVYGRPDPKPGNFTPRLGTTAEYRRIVNQVTGKDYGWFFDVYLGEAALPELVETRAPGKLDLTWKTPNEKPFPLPVEVKVGDTVRTVAMTGGRGSIAMPAGAHVTIDPWAKVLRRSEAVEAVQAQAAAAAAPTTEAADDE